MCLPTCQLPPLLNPNIYQIRDYYIAAEEVVWDYAPFGGEMCGGSLVNFSDNAATFVKAGPTSIGRRYVKALYVEYTDATFTQKKVRAERQLGRLVLQEPSTGAGQPGDDDA